jgi:hypothetical protein
MGSERNIFLIIVEHVEIGSIGRNTVPAISLCVFVRTGMHDIT